MFQTSQEERDFWTHIYSCRRCTERLLEKTDKMGSLPIVLVDRQGILDEIRRYLDGVHANDEIIAQASLNFIEFLTNGAENTNESNVNEPMGDDEINDFTGLLEKYRSLLIHLGICGDCCEKSRDVQMRLIELKPDTIARAATSFIRLDQL
ncbi:MAG TPA: hypothetical protein VF303_02670 [Candidatus Nanoarchaeia archaeon]